MHRTVPIRAEGENTARILHHISCWETCQITDKRSSGKGKRQMLKEPLIHSLIADHWTSLHPTHFLRPQVIGGHSSRAEKEHGSERCCQRTLEGNPNPTCCRHVACTGARCSQGWDPGGAQSAESASHALAPCPVGKGSTGLAAGLPATPGSVCQTKAPKCVTVSFKMSCSRPERFQVRAFLEEQGVTGRG